MRGARSRVERACWGREARWAHPWAHRGCGAHLLSRLVLTRNHPNANQRRKTTDTGTTPNTSAARAHRSWRAASASRARAREHRRGFRDDIVGSRRDWTQHRLRTYRRTAAGIGASPYSPARARTAARRFASAARDVEPHRAGAGQRGGRARRLRALARFQGWSRRPSISRAPSHPRDSSPSTDPSLTPPRASISRRPPPGTCSHPCTSSSCW